MAIVEQIHLILFLWCCLYSVFLNWKPINTRYTPGWVWLTVVGGCAWIGLAQMALIWHGISLTGWLIFSTNLAAGVPVIAWQLIQQWHRIRERRAKGSA